MGISRLLMLSGAAAAGAAAFVPWADVNGPLSLSALGIDADPGGKTVTGVDTAAWPFLVGAAALVFVLAALNKLRKLVMAFGLLLVVGGAGLLYYVLNAVDIETEGVTEALAGAVIGTEPQLGPYLLIGAGVLILAGAASRP